MGDTNCNRLQFPRWLRASASAMVAIVLCSSMGCKTWQKAHESAVSQFGSGDMAVVRASLDESQNSLRAEKKLLELDQGILDLASGNVQQAEGRFRILRHELEHLEQKDITEQASSLLTDSRAVAFSGRDYERRMILNMALLTSLLGDGQDSFAYSLQVTEASAARRDAIVAATQKASGSSTLSDNVSTGIASPAVTPASFAANATAKGTTNSISSSALDQPLALSSYLAAAVQSETPSRQLETDRALADIGFWNPAYSRHDEANFNGEFGTRCKQGNGTLHVIALVGKAPRWVSESAEPTSAALLVADRIISMTGRHTLPPTIASVKVARPEPYGNAIPVGGLKCNVSPSAASANAVTPSLIFSTLVNLNDVAQASYSEHRDEEIGAAIARRVLKKGAVYVLKEAQNISNNSLVDLGINAAGVAWEAMEKPDTRSWRMLPGRIDIARTELPEGEWFTTLQVASYGASGPPQSIPIHIEDGRNTYVLCIIPDRQFTGHILVGGAERSVLPIK